ncbi:peroxisome- protein [Chytridiales sp. JEL 0842]|nr:peroxisome- protein [Chytridiales sp. JEL 0842]
MPAIKLPPLPKLVRFLLRILENVHAHLNKVDTFVARLSWRAPKESDSIKLFQRILLTYAFWILLNSVLSLGVIIMLTGLTVIAWHSEMGEVVRDVVGTEWEKARGRSKAARGGDLKAPIHTPASVVGGNDAGGQQSFGVVSFGGMEATVMLDPYTGSAAGQNENKDAGGGEAAVTKKKKKKKQGQQHVKKEGGDVVKENSVQTAEEKLVEPVVNVKDAKTPAVENKVAAEKVIKEVMEEVAADQVDQTVEAAEQAVRESMAAQESSAVSALLLDDTVLASDKKEDAEAGVSVSTVQTNIVDNGPAVASVMGNVNASLKSDSGEDPVTSEVVGAISQDDSTEPLSSGTSSPSPPPSTSLDSATPSPIMQQTKPVFQNSSNVQQPLTPPQSPLDSAASAAARLQARLAEVARKRLTESTVASSPAPVAVQTAEITGISDAAPSSPLKAPSVTTSSPTTQSAPIVGGLRTSSLHTVLAQTNLDTTPPRISSRIHSELFSSKPPRASPTYPQPPIPAPTPLLSSLANLAMADPTESSGLRQRGGRPMSDLSLRGSLSSGEGIGAGTISRIDAEMALEEQREVQGEKPNKDGDRAYGSLKLSDDEDEEEEDGFRNGDGKSMAETSTEFVSSESFSRSRGNPWDDELASTGRRSEVESQASVIVYDTEDEEDEEGEYDDEEATHVEPGLYGANARGQLRRRQSLESEYDAAYVASSQGIHMSDYNGRSPASAPAIAPRSPPQSPISPRSIPLDPFATKSEREAALAYAQQRESEVYNSSMYDHQTSSVPSSNTNNMYYATPESQGSLISRSSLRGSNRKPLDIVLSFECYENQRWWVGLGWVAHLLPAERPPWSDYKGQRPTPRESFVLLPFRAEQLLAWKKEVNLDLGNKRYAWEWDGPWTVDVEGGGQMTEVDSEGWSYADNFWKDWKSRKTLKRVVRHRRWVRHARLFELGPKQSVTFSSSGSFSTVRDSNVPSFADEAEL